MFMQAHLDQSELSECGAGFLKWAVNTFEDFALNGRGGEKISILGCLLIEFLSKPPSMSMNYI